MVSCSTCFELFDTEGRKQMFLPCLHLICEQCLNDFGNLSKEEHCCRVCEERFDVKDCQFSSVVVTPRCLVHEENEFSAYCETCQELVCDQCITGKHCSNIFHEALMFFFPESLNLRHEIITLQAYLQKANKLLAQHFVGINSAIPKLELLKLELKQKLVAVKQEIEESFRSLVEANPELCEQLHTRSTQLIEEAVKQTNFSIKTTELQQRTLQVAKEHIDLVKQYSPFSLNNVVVLKRIDALQRTNLSLEPVAINNLYFLLHKQDKLDLLMIDKVGRLIRYRHDWTSISQPSLVFGTEGEDIGQLFTPRGIVELEDGNLAIGEFFTQRLQIFTCEGEYVRKIDFDFSVRHIALSPVDGLLWCASSAGFLGVSLQGETLHCILTDSSCGVAILESGLIIGSFDTDHTVRAFSSDGTLAWTSSGFGLRFPRGIISLNAQEIIVCDSGNHRLQVLSALDGHFIRLIDQSVPARPTDVKLIPHTDLMVVSHFSRVSILTLDGLLVHQWGERTKPAERPLPTYSAVAVLKDGRIAVVNEHDCRVQMF